MVDFGTPYAIDGTTIPAEGLRRQSQRDAGAGSGVARPGDLKVTQMNTPGTGVRVAAGDDIIQCRAPNRDRESYSIPNFSAQDWMGDAGTGIPGTGSGVTRRDMIIHEILDPALPRHYTPQAQWPEGALSKITVVPGVAASAKSVKDVPALNDVTCYELAALNWPASTATITNAMIEDLRRLHKPKSDRVFRPADLTVLQRLNGTGAEGVQFPNELTGLIGQIDIPEGMTHARISSILSGVRVPGGASTGQFWVQLGTNADPARVIGPSSSFAPDATSELYRESWIYGATVPIPEAARGTTKSFIMKARVNASRDEAQQIYIDTAGSAIVDIEFFQQAI